MSRTRASAPKKQSSKTTSASRASANGGLSDRPNRRIFVMLKADGYGHGAVAVAKYLASRPIDYFATGSIEEAIAITRVTPTPVVLLGSLAPGLCPLVVAHGLVASLDDGAAAAALSQAAGKRSVEVFVKVDCGFGRFGVALADAPSYIRKIAALPGLRLACVYTHLPFSDATGRSWAANQSRAFEAMIEGLAREGLNVPLTQIMASPGLLGGLTDRQNAVAMGHILYGLSPLGASLAADTTGFRPALHSIVSYLAHIGRRLPEIEAAPYLRDTEGALGVVPIGICHGYRPIPGKAFMMINGGRARVLRPCLESTVVDLSGVPSPACGAEVLVMGSAGERITLEDLAQWQGTTPLSLLIGLVKSLHRRYLPAADEA
jgi:alanine racemase